MADLLLVSTGLVSALFLMFLAGALVVLRFQSRSNRSFALYLFLEGGGLLALNLARLADEGSFWQDLWRGLQPYFLLAIWPTMAYFVLAYTRRLDRRRLLLVGITAVVVGAILEIAYLVDHCAVLCYTSAGKGTGPLYPLARGVHLAVALAGLAVVLHSRSLPLGSRRNCALLVGATLGLAAFIDGALQVVGVADRSLYEQYLQGFLASPWPVVSIGVLLVSLVPALAAYVAAIWISAKARQPAHRKWLWVGAALPLVVAVIIALYYPLDPSASNGLTATTGTLLVGLWRIATPALVAYGLVKHRLFEFDPVIKAAIGPTVVASLFLAVFFAVSQVAQNVLGNEYGPIGGGVATGMLLFALSPLERMSRRIAQAVMPHTKRVHHMDSGEKARLYRDQAELVWADGVMETSERAFLDGLRARLHIPMEEAARLEHEALTAHGHHGMRGHARGGGGRGVPP